jgi:iron complex transport system permease protein
MRGLLTPGHLCVCIILGLVLLLVVVLVCSLMGTESISLRSAFTHPTSPHAINMDYAILMKIRLPRVILAVLVGAALAISGAVFQGLLRNPLADPFILGISSGAGLGAILAVISGLTWTVAGRSPIAVYAFIGALGTVWLVSFIGRLTGRHHITGLLLAGVVVNAFFSALIMFLTSIANSSQVHATLFWLMGNISEESPLILWLGTGGVGAGLVGLYFLAPQLNAISFSDEDARSMGVPVERIRWIAFGIAAFMTAVAVSVSGLVGFVGLVVPHAIRLLFGADHRQLFPLCAIVGGIFLAVADTIARVIVAPAQLPVGVITALIGGPIFVFLLIRYSKNIGALQ